MENHTEPRSELDKAPIGDPFALALAHVPERDDRLRPVRDLARQLGVDFDAIETERVFLRWIENHGAKGSGSAVLRALCALADELQLATALYAAESDGFLIALYRDLGFAVIDPDDEEGALMVREPQEPAP